VEGNFEITVANPAAAVKDQGFITATTATVASQAGAAVKDTTVTLTVARRRLSGSAFRRLQAGNIKCDFVIKVADAAAASTMSSTMASATPATFAATLTSELAKQNVSTDITGNITVSAITAAASIPDSMTTKAADDESSGASGSLLSLAAMAIAVSSFA